MFPVPLSEWKTMGHEEKECLYFYRVIAEEINISLIESISSS